MKILLFGGHGLLGSALRERAPATVEIAAPRRLQVDISDHDAVARAVDAAEPDWIINCAAFTAVDAAEEAPSEAMRVNGEAARTLAALAAARGARLLQFSTDYVFDDPSRATPWREEEPPAPRSAYARSKRAGELAVLESGARALVVRTSWLFGTVGRCFPRTMWQRATARTPSTVVNDQRGVPTSAEDLAGWSWQLVARDETGIVHATNAGNATWFDVAHRIYARSGWAEGVTATSTAAVKSPAARPAYSVLDCRRLDRLLSDTRRPWEAAIDDFLVQLNAEQHP